MTNLLAETLAITLDNLTMTAGIFGGAEGATEELSLEARQRLGLVHAGLAMAIQGLEHDELQQLIKQSKMYSDS